MSNYFNASGANQPAIVLAALVSAFAAFCVWLAYDTGAAAATGSPAALPSWRS